MPKNPAPEEERDPDEVIAEMFAQAMTNLQEAVAIMQGIMSERQGQSLNQAVIFAKTGAFWLHEANIINSILHEAKSPEEKPN